MPNSKRKVFRDRFQKIGRDYVKIHKLGNRLT